MKVYQKDSQESYTLGVFPTIELLENGIKHVKKVILSTKSDKNQGVAKIKAFCQREHIEIEVNDKTIQKLSKKDNCYAVGVFAKYEQHLDRAKNHVVLVNPGDMGNLGTIMRTMLGFGIEDLAIVRPGVDIFDPKAIRASMGAMFHIRFQYFDNFEDYLQANPGHQVYCLMLKGAKSIHHIAKRAPYSLVFGNESSGLPDAFLNYGQSVLIPHTRKIDSLNLSMALGITLYEFTKESFDDILK